MMIINSSYVLISIILPEGSDRMKSTSLGYPGKYIMLSMFESFIEIAGWIVYNIFNRTAGR